MRNKLAKNSIAVGLVTLIITAGLSFSAQAAPTYTSHAEAQFISAGDPALGTILDGLGEASRVSMHVSLRKPPVPLSTPRPTPRSLLCH